MNAVFAAMVLGIAVLATMRIYRPQNIVVFLIAYIAFIVSTVLFFVNFAVATVLFINWIFITLMRRVMNAFEALRCFLITVGEPAVPIFSNFVFALMNFDYTNSQRVEIANRQRESIVEKKQQAAHNKAMQKQINDLNNKLKFAGMYIKTLDDNNMTPRQYEAMVGQVMHINKQGGNSKGQKNQGQQNQQHKGQKNQGQQNQQSFNWNANTVFQAEHAPYNPIFTVEDDELTFS